MSRSYGRNLYIKNDSLFDIELRRDRTQLSVQNESKVMNASGKEETMIAADNGHICGKRKQKFIHVPWGNYCVRKQIFAKLAFDRYIFFLI
jgi:hypothetical protein